MNRLRILTLGAILWSQVSCLLHYSLRNGPGHDNIRKAPHDLSRPQTLLPYDPGEYSLKWNVGLLPSLAIARQPAHPKSTRVGFALSAESGLYWGWDRSSMLYPMPRFARALPRHALGLSQGVTLGAAPWLWRMSIYEEVQYIYTSDMDLWIGLGVGPVYDFQLHQLGWQSTAIIWPLYLRVSAFPHTSIATEIGLSLKMPIVSKRWGR